MSLFNYILKPVKDCAFLILCFLFFANVHIHNAAYCMESMVVDTLIVRYATEYVYSSESNDVIDVTYGFESQFDTLYVEVENSDIPGLLRHWNIGMIDSINESLIMLIKDFAIRSRNVYYEHYGKLDSLKSLLPEELYQNYRLLYKGKYKIGERLDYLPQKSSLGKDKGRYIFEYSWNIADKVSGIELIFWYDINTGKCINGIIMENYEMFKFSNLQKKLNMNIPVFFNNKPLTEDELIKYGYRSHNGKYKERLPLNISYFYTRDIERLMQLNMDAAIEKLGKPVGILSFYYGKIFDAPTKPPIDKQGLNIEGFAKVYFEEMKENRNRSYYRDFIDNTTDSLKSLASSDIACNRKFEGQKFEDIFMKRHNVNKLKDIRKLVWLRDQTVYISVFYTEKDGVWMPVDMYFWDDWY